MPQTIFRLPAVRTESGYSRSTIYLRISQGLWTKQVSLGPRCVGWPAHEVAELNSARIGGLSDDEIRDLVRALHAARKSSRAARAQTYGANKAASVIRQVCPSCGGSGEDPGSDETCARCAGSGWEPHAD